LITLVRPTNASYQLRKDGMIDHADATADATTTATAKVTAIIDANTATATATGYR
jgi:hypothetical protein